MKIRKIIYQILVLLLIKFVSILKVEEYILKIY